MSGRVRRSWTVTKIEERIEEKEGDGRPGVAIVWWSLVALLRRLLGTGS